MSTENLPGARAEAGADVHTELSVEDRARRFGWHPKDKYHGPPENWVDAEEFVRRSEEQLPILRENLKKEEKRSIRLEAQMGQTRAEMQAMAAQLSEAREAVMDMRNLLTTAEERSYQRAINEINTRMDQAVEEGDKDAVAKARKDLETVQGEMAKRAKKPDDKAPPAPKVVPNATAAAWVNSEDQAWYRENPDAKGYADGYFDRLNANPGTKDLPLEDKLERVRVASAKKFPEYFGEDAVTDQDPDADPEPPRRAAAKVTSPRPPVRNGDGQGKRFEDIPKADQEIYYRQARQIEAHIKNNNGRGKPFTKEEFAKGYFE